MAKQSYKDRLLAGSPQASGVGTSGTGSIATGNNGSSNNGDSPPASAPNNLQKRDAAHQHLDELADQAEGLQIGGRSFYGFVEIHIRYENGFAQEVTASRFARDRVDMRPKF